MIYLFALAAGFAMNFMPCVLPVIGLKLSAFRYRKSPYILGVFVSFMLLATLAVVTGAGLSHMSYGFLRAILAAVCFLMGTKLLGVWQWNVRIPGVLGEWGGPFGTGLVTVALSSSCSVPFLAPALAYCAMAGVYETYGIFAAMGFGFVSPFLIPFPMPRPGKWSVWFERGCGVSMLVVASWLSLTLSSTGFLLVAALLFVMWWVISLASRQPETMVATGIFVPPILVLVLCSWFWTAEPPVGLSLPMNGDRVIIATADWCINCPIANHAWKEHRVIWALAERNIVPIKLDWTHRDPRITAFLKSHNHQSVPFALIEVDGRVTILSGLYTSRDVLEALRPRN